MALAHGAAARAAAAVYAVSLLGLFGVSAAYHRLHWSESALRRMKRLDHSMIFVLIAGSYTPFALLVLHGPLSRVVLVAVWGGAVAGMVLKMVSVDGFRVLTGVLYIGLGWLAVLATPSFLHGMSPAAVALLAIGGIVYTGGAIVLWRRRPNPVPSTFGYHEVWHSMTIGASACHYAAVLMVVLAAPAAVR